jgi:hypothetical protein
MSKVEFDEKLLDRLRGKVFVITGIRSDIKYVANVDRWSKWNWESYGGVFP